MANLFSYSVKVCCDKKHIEKLVEYFEDKLYCCDGFYYEKRDFGFVGQGACRWSFIGAFEDDICEITQKYNATIEAFGEDVDDCLCEYMYVDNGGIIETSEGWCYHLDIDTQDEYEEIEDYVKFLNELLFGEDEDEYLTYEELETCEWSDGCYLYEFYYDFWD